MRSAFRIVIGLLLLLAPAGCGGLRIVPTFTDSAGLEWTDERKAVVRRAIADYERAIAEDETIAVEFKFFEAEPGIYGMWYAIDFPPEGSSVRPWTQCLTHVIMMDANHVDQLVWFDPTPLTDDDIPEDRFDAVTLIRHELAHMLGHRPGYVIDYDADGQMIDYWANQIDTDSVFDPEGLNIRLIGDLEHVDGEDLMNGWMKTGRRYDIDAAVQRLVVAYGYKTFTDFK